MSKNDFLMGFISGLCVFGLVTVVLLMIFVL